MTILLIEFALLAALWGYLKITGRSLVVRADGVSFEK